MKVYPIILGCPKNIADSENLLPNIIEDIEIVNSPKSADIIYIDTCAFIYPAVKESVDTIIEAEKFFNDKTIIVGGCLLGRYKEEIIKNFSFIKRWIPPEEKERISYFNQKENKRMIFSSKNYAYLKIADGCNELCSFCIIPKIKGKYRSRNIKDILIEAKKLIESGIKEIILISQNSYYYGKDLGYKNGLLQLVESLSKIEGDFHIRILYGNPDFWSKDIKEVYYIDKVLKYFDLPFQHFDYEIIKSMRRKVYEEKIFDIIEDIRESFRRSAIRSSIIVGYPLENEEKFERLCEAIKVAKFDWLSVFEFYPEEGTLAYKLTNPISLHKAKKRKKILLEIQKSITENRLKSYIGNREWVILDEIISETKERFEAIAHTWFLAPEIDGEIFIQGKREDLSSKMEVEFVGAIEYSLFGDVV